MIYLFFTILALPLVVTLILAGMRLWAWGLLKPNPLPSRVELKLCSQWTLFPVAYKVVSSHKTKTFWLVHLPFVDLWLHFEGQ